MDASQGESDTLAKYASKFFFYRHWFSLLGHGIRCPDFPQFYAELMRTLHDWALWLTSVLSGVERRSAVEKGLHRLKTATRTLLSQLRHIRRELEMELRYSRQLRKVEHFCVDAATADLCQELLTDALMFLQLLPQLGRHLVPTGKSAWLPTKIAGTLAEVQNAIFDVREDIGLYFCNVHAELIDYMCTHMGNQEFDDAWSRYVNSADRSGPDASLNDEETQKWREDDVKVTKLTDLYFRLVFDGTGFQVKMLKKMTQVDSVANDDPTVAAARLETFHSFVRRFMSMLWATIGYVASRYQESSVFEALGCFMIAEDGFVYV